jgi:hypothetical protein
MPFRNLKVEEAVVHLLEVEVAVALEEAEAVVVLEEAEAVVVLTEEAELVEAKAALMAVRLIEEVCLLNKQ